MPLQASRREDVKHDSAWPLQLQNGACDHWKSRQMRRRYRWSCPEVAPKGAASARRRSWRPPRIRTDGQASGLGTTARIGPSIGFRWARWSEDRIGVDGDRYAV